MQRLRGFGSGLSKKLSAIVPERKPAQAEPRTSGDRVLQRRPTLTHRGPRQEPFGETPNQRRSANIKGTLAERIVYRELERRQELFSFEGDQQTPNLAALGINISFLIFSRVPNVALDIHADEPKNTDLLGNSPLKGAFLESMGMRYEVLIASRDVYPSAARLEERLDDILGLSLAGILTLDRPESARGDTTS